MQYHTSLSGPSDDPAESVLLTRAILDIIDTAILVLGKGGRIQYVNPACERLTGYAADELVGEVVFDVLVPPDDRADVRSYWQALWAGEADPRHRNAWGGKDGERRYIEWLNALVEVGDARRFVVATGTDVTRQRELERDVVHVSESERQRIGQELHDGLASDLTAAAMKINTLRDRLETGSLAEEEVLSRLESIEQSVRKGSRQARSLSHLLAAGDLRPQELPEALSELVRTYREYSGIGCALQLPDGGFPELRENVPGHLYRIAQEAVRNAVHHGDPHHVEICLEYSRSRSGPEGSGSEMLILRVRDDGTGFPKEGAADLALSEEQGEGADPEANGGNRSLEEGLGLHLMRYRADLIGASLAIDSEKGRGTEVRCEVPLS